MNVYLRETSVRNLVKIKNESTCNSRAIQYKSLLKWYMPSSNENLWARGCHPIFRYNICQPDTDYSFQDFFLVGFLKIFNSGLVACWGLNSTITLLAKLSTIVIENGPNNVKMWFLLALLIQSFLILEELSQIQWESSLNSSWHQ